MGRVRGGGKRAGCRLLRFEFDSVKGVVVVQKQILVCEFFMFRFHDYIGEGGAFFYCWLQISIPHS